MHNLLNPDNRVMRLITKIADSVFLNLLWLIFSLPVITAGASTTALFDISLKLVNDEEGSLFKGFWNSFRSNLKTATRTWLILLAGGIVFAFDAAAQARSKAEENRLAEKVSAETAQEPDGPGRGILELQQNLIRLGYDEVVPDGTWNPSTRAALETFRERYGIETAGPEALDRETEERIYIQLGFKDEIGMDPFADRD